MAIRTAQDYLALHRQGRVPPAMSGLAQDLVNARMGEIQLRTGPSYGIGFGSTPWADLPTPIASSRARYGGRVVRQGSQTMVYVPGLVNTSNDPLNAQQFSTMDPWGNLKDVVMTKLRSGVDANRTGLSLRPEIRDWGARHLFDLNAAGGALNIGMVPTLSRRRKLFFNDAGARARAMADSSQAFMSAVLSSHESTNLNNVHTAYNTYRRNYIEEIARVLRQVRSEDGAHINLHGIKDVSFQKIRRFQGGNWIDDSELLVNSGKASQYQVFGQYADQLAGDHHINQYVALPTMVMKDKRVYFDANAMHPLVGPSSYGEDLSMMARTLNRSVRDFGTQVRADVGYIHGGWSELFASHAFGDAGSLVTSRRMMNAAAYASREYKKKIVGVIGHSGIPDGNATISDQILNIPGVKELLENKNEKYLELNKPVAINSKILATFKDGKKIKAIRNSDSIYAVQKTADGIKLFMRRSKPVFKTGRPILNSGSRGTLGRGASVSGLDLITHGMKSGDPRVVRERWAAHYASKVFGLEGLDQANRVKALNVFAEHAGLGVGTFSGGRVFTHSDSGWMKGAFGEGTNFMSRDFMTGLAEKLNKAVGGNLYSADYLAPSNRRLTKKMAIAMLAFGGRMDEASAIKLYNSKRKFARQQAKKEGIKLGFTGKALSKYVNDSSKLFIQRLEGQNIKFRATDVGDTKSRVRALEADNLMSKLLDYSGPDKELATKAAGIVGSNLNELRNYVKYSQAAQVAPLFGQEAIDSVVRRAASEAGGTINVLKLSDIANPELYDEVTRSLNETGTLTPDLANKFLDRFKMTDDSYGTMIDLRGTHLSGMTLFSGARKMESPDAMASSVDHLFIHNIKRVIPDINRRSVTGNFGDMAIIPRKSVVAGMDGSEHKSLNVIANTFNAYLELLNPYAARGYMEERMWLHNASVREMMTGSKGMISHKPLKGFIGGRFTAQTLGAEDDLAIGMTEAGIKRAFGAKTGSTGDLMLAELRAGRDAFAFYKRDPAQSTQQIIPVRIKLLQDIELKKIKAKGINANVMEAETMWVSRLLAGASQADFDSDQMNLYLLGKGKGLTYTEQQKLLRSMYLQERKRALPFAKMLDQAALGNDQVARRLLHLSNGSPLEAMRIAEAMAGGKFDETIKGGTKFQDIASPFAAVDKILSDIGYGKDQIDEALRAAVGGAQRQLQSGGGVGIMHTFATQQQKIMHALTDPSLSPYNIPHNLLMEEAKKLGVDSLTSSKNSEYIRFIYGFLKKGTQATGSTLTGIAAIKASVAFNPDTAEYRRLADRLAQELFTMSKGVSGSGNAWYSWASSEGLSAAEKAAAAGLDAIGQDSSYYRSMAEDMLKLARLEKWAGESGRTGNSLMGTSREPFEFIKQVISEATGLGSKVNLPNTTSAGAKLGEKMAEKGYIKGATSGNNVVRTIASAADGIPGAMKEFGDLLEDSSKGWGKMKAIAIGVSAFALIDAMGSSRKTAEPPEVQPDMSGAPMPPSPQVGFPSDGARPSALASPVQTARINRVPGQRRHFGGESQIFMGSPLEMDIQMPESLSGSDLGSIGSFLPESFLE